MQILSRMFRTYTNDLCQRMIRETETYLNRHLHSQYGRPASGAKSGGKDRPAGRG